MIKRPSVAVLLVRYFLTIFGMTFVISLFWNTLSGMDMFPLRAVIGVSVLLTALFNVIGWVVVNGGSKVLLDNDPEFQRWKQQGGRPYWDSIGWPINPTPPNNRDDSV